MPRTITLITPKIVQEKRSTMTTEPSPGRKKEFPNIRSKVDTSCPISFRPQLKTRIIPNLRQTGQRNKSSPIKTVVIIKDESVLNEDLKSTKVVKEITPVFPLKTNDPKTLEDLEDYLRCYAFDEEFEARLARIRNKLKTRNPALDPEWKACKTDRNSKLPMKTVFLKDESTLNEDLKSPEVVKEISPLKTSDTKKLENLEAEYHLRCSFIDKETKARKADIIKKWETRIAVLDADEWKACKTGRDHEYQALKDAEFEAALAAIRSEEASWLAARFAELYSILHM